MKFLIQLFLIMVIGMSPLLAKEYFGQFQDELQGTLLTTGGQPTFRLESDFRFLDPNGLVWTTPAETEVDGASIPQAFWSMIGGPFSGNYINASVIHDYYCYTKSRTAHDTHRNFFYGMRASGVDAWKAKFMYWVVSTFGPDWKLEKRLEQQMRCEAEGGRTVCNQVPTLVVKRVPVPGADLEDPEVLATALSKASTVARSLKTTQGEMLDITPQGATVASLEKISSSANTYRALFGNKAYQSSPEKLGVLSKWNANGLDDVKSWQGTQLPTFDAAVELDRGSVERIDNGAQFKIMKRNFDLMSEQLDTKALEYKMEIME